MTDHRAEARSHSARAAAATRRARRDAERAASYYDTAASVTDSAAWLARHPDLHQDGYTPAELEDRARSWETVADSMLRASFHATRTATFYRDLAARYREMADARDARMAEPAYDAPEPGTTALECTVCGAPAGTPCAPSCIADQAMPAAPVTADEDPRSYAAAVRHQAERQPARAGHLADGPGYAQDHTPLTGWTHAAEPEPGSVRTWRNDPVRGEAAAIDYPLGARCAGCRDEIAKADPGDDWYHLRSRIALDQV